MPFYLLGLGSNLQPDHHLPQARQALKQLGQICDCSPVVVTEPVGDTFCHEFCNQLAILHCSLNPTQLKNELLKLEEQLGREPKTPTRQFNDRTIDIDILAQAENVTDCRHAQLNEDYYLRVQQRWNQG